MIYHCCTDNRKALVKTKTSLNGIDYLEVAPTDVLADKQKTIQLHFIRPLTDPIVKESIIVKEGDRITSITAETITTNAQSDTIEIKLTDRGNFSIYTLCLRKERKEFEVLDNEDNFLVGFDKILSSIDFSFKVECNTEIDCKPAENDCGELDLGTPPEINYLAKDYASFKQLMLDRMSLLIPDWTERNAADLGITLVEQLAYVADYLSYRQDAISTEAYLGTSRKRISVRRHARLVDYHMHDGLNARAWIHIEITPGSDGILLKKIDGSGEVTKFLTKGTEEVRENHKISQIKFAKTFRDDQIVFEPQHDLQLFHEHNQISFHTYGDNNCCLPKGATEASLVGSLGNLKPGRVLIFQEIRGPETGVLADADPLHRHAVRIEEIDRKKDFDFSGTTATEIDIAIIHWSEEDALPFPLCISSTISNKNNVEEIIEVSVAKGNMVLVDHGITFSDEDALKTGLPFENIKGSVVPALAPQGKLNYARSQTSNHCAEAEIEPIYPRYNPILDKRPITHSETILPYLEAGSDIEFLPKGISAKKLMLQDERKTTPEIILHEIRESGTSYIKLDDIWEPVQDLLVDSSDQDKHFVLETESDGVAHIRFGNTINGKKPEPESKFIARYRIGNGTIGNIGRDTVHQLVYNDALEVIKISNPLSAYGGLEPETKEEVKQFAPRAFRTQKRAVTSQDYETMARHCKDDLQSTTASFRWTGSWRTAFITADRVNGQKVTPECEEELSDCLEEFRMAGVDIEIDDPHYVGLEIEMQVCLNPNYFKIAIEREIRILFSSTIRLDGKLGMFHPDNFVFGQSVYLSQLYEMAQNIDGVDSVNITKFQRQGVPNSSGIKSGILTFGRQEIARLDNDPNFRDRGVFNLKLKGGR